FLGKVALVPADPSSHVEQFVQRPARTHPANDLKGAGRFHVVDAVVMGLSCLRGDDGRSGTQAGARVCTGPLRRRAVRKPSPPWRLPTDPVRQSCRYVAGELPRRLSVPAGRWQGRLPWRQWGRSAHSIRAVGEFGQVGWGTPAARTA